MSPAREPTSDDINEQPRFSNFIKIVVFLSALSGLVSGLTYWAMLHRNGISADPAQWGQMGDYFGGILNPILAFFSLLMICYTLWLQIEESAKSARFNAIQRFESMLFELVRLHRENLDSIDLWSKDQNREVEGRDCFPAFLGWIRTNFGKVDPQPSLRDTIAEAYRVFYEDYGKKSEVGHYFRNLYHIFKYIDESPLLTRRERNKYAKIVRAQLSSAEAALLFFNGLHPRGRNFVRYIEEFALLQDLDETDLDLPGVSESEMHQIYNKSAFADEVE